MSRFYRKTMKPKILVLSLLGLGRSLSSHISEAASYNSTVDTAVITLQDTDTVNTTNQQGVIASSTAPALAIGSGGKITVNSIFNQSDATSGTVQRSAINLQNNTLNELGTGSTIIASYVDPTYGGTNKSLTGIFLGPNANLNADKLSLTVTNASTTTGAITALTGIQAFSNLNLGSQSNITVQAGKFSGATGLVIGKSLVADHLTLNISGTITSLITLGTGATIDLGQGSSLTSTALVSSSGLSMTANSSLVADNLTISLKKDPSMTTINGSPVIMMNSLSAVNVKNNSTVYSEVDQAAGVYAFGTNTNFNADSNLTITTKGINSQGAIAQSASSVVNLGKNATITTYGDTTYIPPNTVNYSSSAVMAREGGKIIIGDGSTLTTYGNGYSNGIYAYDTNAQVQIGDNVTITTNGNSAYGIMAYRNNPLVTAGRNFSVTTRGNDSTGVLSQGATVNLGQNASVQTYGSNAYTAEVYLNGTITADSSAFSAANSDSEVFHANSTAKVTLTGTNGATRINAANGLGTALNFSGASQFLGTGTMNIAGNILTANTSTMSLNLGSYSSILGNVTHGSTTAAVFNLGDNSAISGNLTNIGASQSTFTLGANSFLGGSITNPDTSKGTFMVGPNSTVNSNVSTSGAGQTNFTLGANSSFTGSWSTDSTAIGNFDLPNSVWQMTGDSTLTTLNASNSTIDFATNISGISGQNQVLGSLTIDTLNGDNNLFKMRTDMENLNGDLLTVNGSSIGDHRLFVFNQGGANVDPTATLTIIKTSDGIATFDLINEVEVGGYLYDIRQDNTDWQLYSTGKSSNPTNGAINLFSGAYLLEYAETQTLLQRTGDLRQSDDHGSVWARAFGGKFEVNGDNFLHGYDMTYSGVQTGIDKKISTKKGDFYIGGAFGFSKGNLDYLMGSGTVDSKTIGIYGTFVAPSGFYSDLLLKYGWMDSDFKVADSEGVRVTGDDISTRGASASLEIGQRIHFDQKEKQGFYIEPQAQFSYGHQSGDSFTASNGLNVKVNGHTSALGRIGANLGYEIKNSKNPINIYLKASYLKEFDGDVGYHLNNIENSVSYGDTWWTYGVGITAQIKQQHNLYLDIERATGGQFKQPWAINAGYRFTW